MIGQIPITLAFDSVIITSITGLPPGFTYACFDGQNVTSPMDQCAFEGGTTGCVVITGTPSLGDEGVYNLSIITEAYLGGLSTPQATINVDYYTIVVDLVCAVNVFETSNATFKLYPNPVVESFTLDGLEGLNVSTISIANTEGKILKSFNAINSSSFDMNVSELEGGIYFVRITHGHYVDVVRFVKK